MIAILLGVLGVVVALGVRRERRAAGRRGADDLRRVGDDGDGAVDAHEAARRAQGRSAWTRFIGGGGL